MLETTRRPNHPGAVLDELYVKPLNLNLQELADHLGISRNNLFKIRRGRARITPSIAIRLGEAFDNSPNLWLNLQQKYDLWVEEHDRSHKPITPLCRHSRATRRFKNSRAIA